MVDKNSIGIQKHVKGKKGYNCYQGHFEDYVTPKKYYGNMPIIFRSKLEYKYMMNLEMNPEVEKWSSEEITIPYIIPEKVNGKVVIKHRQYLTDFTVHKKNGKKFIVEIKYFSQSPRTKQQIKEDEVARKNAYKWKAAIEWCKNNGYEFVVINEDKLR